MSDSLTPEMLLRGYCLGAFPMARSREDGQVQWLRPDPRAILPLEPEAFHVPRSLAKRVRSGRFHITLDAAFERVIRACAEPTADREDTWINDAIIDAYTRLHHAGFAHSVEAWVQEEGREEEEAEPAVDRGADDVGWRLAGGLYGVSLGAAFFGESMFTRAPDASKVCLVRLVEHLREQGFELLDVQFTNPHLDQFGVVEIPHDDYFRQLQQAINQPVSW